jgi:hypothetical protein
MRYSKTTMLDNSNLVVMFSDTHFVDFVQYLCSELACVAC